jgi:Tat protein secretion system quality control protein TatD with DNase activity
MPHDMRAGTRFNEPANLTVVVERIAELREISVEKAAEITTENAKRVFLL